MKINDVYCSPDCLEYFLSLKISKEKEKIQSIRYVCLAQKRKTTYYLRKSKFHLKLISNIYIALSIKISFLEQTYLS